MDSDFEIFPILDVPSSLSWPHGYRDGATAERKQPLEAHRPLEAEVSLLLDSHDPEV